VRVAPIRSRIRQHHDCSGVPADNLLVYPLAEDCVVPDERKRHHCTDNCTARIPLDELRR